MHIRRAHADEHPTLTRVAHEAKAFWGYAAADLAAWESDLTATHASVLELPTFVAEVDGGIAGFFQLSVTDGEVELEHLWVRPAEMGKGIGRALLTHAIREAAAAGYAVLHIDADPNAEPFYLACGAIRSGSKPAPIATEPERVRPQLVIAASST